MVNMNVRNDQDYKTAFGAFLRNKRLAQGKKVKQSDVLKHLLGWSAPSYSRLEDGITAPRFDDLVVIHHAFRAMGISFSFAEKQQYVKLAHQRIDLQQTYKYQRSEDAWAQLLLDLLREDDAPEKELSRHRRALSQPDIADIAHLVERPSWREELLGGLAPARGKKWLVIRGTAGIGKSSELSWLATKLLGQSSQQVIFCNLRSRENVCTPEEAFLAFLGAVFSDLGLAYPQLSSLSFQNQTTLFLDVLERSNQKPFLLIDHGETILQEDARLAPCWNHLFTHFLRGRHQAKIVMTTRHWLAWTGNDPLLVDETTIPPLSLEQSLSLLHRLGLNEVPKAVLQETYQAFGGTPITLEWVATWVKYAAKASWESFEMEQNEVTGSGASSAAMTKALRQLLAGPRVFGGPPESIVAPFLERLLSTQVLSNDARHVLQVLSLTGIPLSKSALEVISPKGPGSYEELCRASLVVASRARAQLLPMVATAVMRTLTEEQVKEAELLLIEAYTVWFGGGMVYEREAGGIVAELATLLLKYYHLLEAAQLLIRYGWTSLNLGHGPRLARLAQTILNQMDWHDTEEHECAGLVLVQILFPFLGQPVDPKSYADYQRIRSAIVDKKVTLPVATGIYVTYLLMLDATNNARFEDAQALLDAYSTSLEQKTVLLGEQAFLFKAWSDYAEVQGDKQQARRLREQTIDLYRQLASQLSSSQEVKFLEEEIRKKRLASCLNNLAYHLNIMGSYEEALQMIEQSISLKEQGYVYVGALAASYGEKAEILIELGRFQEALVFDEKAMAEILRCANVGDALSQREKWIYQVIRGRLYLRLGNVDEAERLFQEALPHIHPKRRMYRMFAEDGLNEIEQWRQQSVTPQHQLDWRWIKRYRELCSYDSRWWLTWAGPFTEEEQVQWDQLFALPLDEPTKTQLGLLMKVSRERELTEAIAEQRQPRLHYPAIAIEDIRHRIEAQLALKEEIGQQEPNALVRRFYQDAIEEELDYLRLIEATYECNTERFWEYNCRLLPLPSKENVEYAFTLIKHILRQGLENPKTAEVSQQLHDFVCTQLHLSLDLIPEEETQPENRQSVSSTPIQQHTVSAQIAQRFFSTILHEDGYTDWQVVIDQNATGARIEKAARCIYLPEKHFSLDEIKHLFIHELAGHVARCIAGDHSPLGLLGIHTRNCQPTEEGLALYYERQAATLRGEPFDDSGIRIGTLALGLVCGVITPPQTFLSLFTFLEFYSLLARLLRHPEANKEELQKLARQYALSICLRIYRGVPNLEQPEVCYLQDVVYLHGLRLIENAVAQDVTVLDRLAVGKIALEHLPDLQELGIVNAPQHFKKLVFDPNLDSYILSFIQSEDGDEKSQ